MMNRFYKLTDNSNRIINIDEISMIDYDNSIDTYMILIHGLDYNISVSRDDAMCIIDKLDIINNF
jgi:hypothetical protein